MNGLMRKSVRSTDVPVTIKTFVSSLCAVAVISIVAVVGAPALNSNAQSQDEDAAPVAAQQQWAAIAKGRIDIEGGTIRLAAQREGLIKEVMVEEGDRVTKGQILATLETTAAQLAIDQAEAELAAAKGQILVNQTRLAAAKREAERLAPLVKSGIVSRKERDQSKDAVANLEAENQLAMLNIATAEKRLDVLRYEIEARNIRSPLDGRIIRRAAKPGDGTSVQTVTELFLLAPDAPRIVKAELDEQFVGAVKPGQDAEIILEFDENQKFKGKVLRIGEVFGLSKNKDDPNAVQDTRVVELVTAVEGAEKLRIGQRVLVQIKP
jgi:HlyD family secretion protein